MAKTIQVGKVSATRFAGRETTCVQLTVPTMKGGAAIAGIGMFDYVSMPWEDFIDLLTVGIRLIRQEQRQDELVVALIGKEAS